MSKKKSWTLLSLLVLLASILAGCGSTPEPAQPPTEAIKPAEPAKLKLATTTSTENSGLLAYLLPFFEEEYGVTVEVIAVGTGQALQLGQDGNADVLMVHARAREDAFMDAGHGVRREDLMYNDFVIVGPEADPAGIQDMNEAPKALSWVAETEAPFVSRGDDSGTHIKEKAIWAEAGVGPAGDWYSSAGQGMGGVLTMADEQQAYTLSDRATYLARTLEGTELVILVEGDPILFNPYGVMAVNPDKNPQINNELANQFIDWLVSLPAQERIAEFGVAEFGAPLFTPDSAAWHEAQRDAEQPAGDIALKIAGLVCHKVGWTEEQVRAMETTEAESTNSSGATETYTGVRINDLLAQAGPKSGATTLVFVADDGSSAQVALTEVQACQDCILSFRKQGGFSTVLPGFPGETRVKGIVEIQVE